MRRREKITSSLTSTDFQPLDEPIHCQEAAFVEGHLLSGKITCFVSVTGPSGMMLMSNKHPLQFNWEI